ncbi:hypothetical protein [Pseudomonas sp. NPDC089569]|uniref:hypothetical protein n=1 Tax=Pseudomonas sp. NPDC089569 TaxID=3390722 RepID=UPI003D028A51
MTDEVDVKVGEEQVPQLTPPTFGSPKSGYVEPGFLVTASTLSGSEDRWELKVMEGDNELYFFEVESSRFSHHVPYDKISFGTRFSLRLRYQTFPIWSQWASLDNLIMVDGKPMITSPVDGDFTGSRPYVTGHGIPFAQVKLYQAGSGVVVHGTTSVNSNRSWIARVDVEFPKGSFELTANQSFDGWVSDWADSVKFTVTDKPVIESPVNGAVTSLRPRVTGRGEIGAEIKLYQAGNEDVVYGTAVVDRDRAWETIPSVDFSPGSFDLTARQSLNGWESDWADSVKLTVKT